jgi:homoserine O-acetyltransferase/O-succinyltransferase
LASVPGRFRYQLLNGYFSVIDPNDLLCMAWKWPHGDVSRHTGGDLWAALGRIKAKTFVMPMSSDIFLPGRLPGSSGGPFPMHV